MEDIEQLIEFMKQEIDLYKEDFVNKHEAIIEFIHLLSNQGQIAFAQYLAGSVTTPEYSEKAQAALRKKLISVSNY